MSTKRRSFTISLKLEALKYAEETSGEAAARKYNVTPSNIRAWKKFKISCEKLAKRQKPEEGHEGQLFKKSQHRRLTGAGRKPFFKELDAEVFSWISSQRENGLRVSKRLIQEKARELFPTLTDSTAHPNFKASIGWVRRFMVRNGLSLCRKTTTAQKDPDQMCEKIVSFIMYVSKKRTKLNLKPDDIIAMDETALCFDMLSNTTVDTRGTKTVQLKSTGHEKLHFTVVLAARADGGKLKPFIVFKQGVREVKKLQDVPGVVIVSSNNGWMNDNLTSEWLSKVYGKFSFRRRMLVWDSYKCHISCSTKTELGKYNTEVAVVPGGCTKYVQAPDVSWNKPFKAHITQNYDKWLAGDKEKELTKGGNLRAASRSLVTEWVKNAWDAIPKELIQKSFRVCALTTSTDGTDDDEIHCLKEGQPCFPAFQLLKEARENQTEIDFLALQELEDPDEMENNEFQIDLSEDEETLLSSGNVENEDDLPDYESDSDN